MKKIFGLLLALFLIFTISVKVEAKTISVSDIETQIKADNPSIADVIGVETNSSNPNKLDIKVAGSTLLTIDYVDGVMSYEGTNSSATTALNYIINAVSKLQNQGKTAEEIKSNISSYTYAKNKIEGTVDSNGYYTYLKLDTNNINLSGSSSGGTTVNPKTGVSIPVVGISLLIIGSVVCLIWVGKNNIFKGL